MPHTVNAVVKSWDIPICKLLAKCREMISLVDFVVKSVTLHLLMNINELVLLHAVSSRVYVIRYLIIIEASIL